MSTSSNTAANKTQPITFFLRTKDDLQILSYQNDQTKQLAALPSPPKSATWSADGLYLAVCDSSRGVVIIDLMTLRCKIKLLPNSNTTTQQIWFSATSKYVVTHHRDYSKEAKNLVVWDVETLTVINHFYIPKLENKNMCPLIWNCDESTALRQFLKVMHQLEYYVDYIEFYVRFLF